MDIKIVPASRTNKRNKTTHVFMHLGAGSVEYVGTWASQQDALRHIGGQFSAYVTNYHQGKVSVVKGKSQDYHFCHEDAFNDAFIEATRRSYLTEVYPLCSLEKLNKLPVETLQVLFAQLP